MSDGLKSGERQDIAQRLFLKCKPTGYWQGAQIPTVMLGVIALHTRAQQDPKEGSQILPYKGQQLFSRRSSHLAFEGHGGVILA